MQHKGPNSLAQACAGWGVLSTQVSKSRSYTEVVASQPVLRLPEHSSSTSRGRRLSFQLPSSAAAFNRDEAPTLLLGRPKSLHLDGPFHGPKSILWSRQMDISRVFDSSGACVKPVIDTLAPWQKGKGDLAKDFQEELSHP
jgi:hypothetical protein